MSDESTGFLYPFIEEEETDAGALLIDLGSSARSKAAESAALQASSLAELIPLVERAGAEMGARFARGGRLYTFGNGGSSTDATTLAGLFCNPPVGRPLPAWSLTDDQAVLTALGNDIGFDVIFSRQIIAHATADDIAVAMATSGNSDDLLAGLREAKRRGLMTIGFAGYDGGEMASSEDVDVCFVIRSQSIHRIQESQALVGHRLWSVAQEATRAARLGGPPSSASSSDTPQPTGGTA